jgi:hypothetical protein
VVVEHVLSRSLWKEIFHQPHKHAKDFVLIELLGFFVVYNVFDVVVVELLTQNPNQVYPRFIH